MLLLTNKTHSLYLKTLAMLMAIIFSFEATGYSAQDTVYRTNLRVPMGIKNSRLQEARETAEEPPKSSVGSLAESIYNQWGGDELILTYDGLEREHGISPPIDREKTEFDKKSGKPLRTVYRLGDKVKLSRTIEIDEGLAREIIAKYTATSIAYIHAGGTIEKYRNFLKKNYGNVGKVLAAIWNTGPPGLTTAYSQLYQKGDSKKDRYIVLTYEIEIPAEKVVRWSETNPLEAFNDLSRPDIFEYGFIDPEGSESEISFLGSIPQEYIVRIKARPFEDGTLLDLNSQLLDAKDRIKNLIDVLPRHDGADGAAVRGLILATEDKELRRMAISALGEAAFHGNESAATLLTMCRHEAEALDASLEEEISKVIGNIKPSAGSSTLNNQISSPTNVAAKIQATLSGIIEEAQRKRLIGMPLMDELTRSYDAMAEVGPYFGKNPGTNLEERLFTTIELLENLFEENAQPLGLPSLFDSGRVHPQEEINWLVSLKAYFDRNGNAVDILRWLQQYYAPLSRRGLGISISYWPVESPELTEWINFVELNEKDKEIIEIIRKEKIKIPVILLRYGNSDTKKIPIIMTHYKQDEKGSLAVYSATELATGSTKGDTIRIRALSAITYVGAASLPEMMSILIHEIDHAIFSFVCDSELKQLGRRLVDIKIRMGRATSIAELDELAKERRLVLRSIEDSRRYHRVGRSIVKEGLAQNAEKAFLDEQILGLVERKLSNREAAAKEKIITGLRLISLSERLDSQLSFDMAFYSTGAALVSLVIDENVMQELYFTDVLDKLIAQDSNLVKSVLSFFAHAVNGIIDRRNQITRTQIPQYTSLQMRAAIETGLGSRSDMAHFFFKERIEEILSQVYDIVDSMNDKQIRKKIKALRSKYPNKVKLAESRSTNKKDTLMSALFMVALAKEIDRLFEEILSGDVSSFLVGRDANINGSL